MKSTGVVRKLDNLNRIVLPMELCRTQKFKENQPLEVFVEDGNIILKKYYITDEMNVIEQRILYFSSVLYETHGIENCVMKMDFNGVNFFSKINCDNAELHRNNGKKAYRKKQYSSERIDFVVKEFNDFKHQLIYNLPNHKMVLLSNKKFNEKQKEIANSLVDLV